MYLVSFADHWGAVAESETALFGDFLLFDNSALGEQSGFLLFLPDLPGGHPSSGNRRRYRSLFSLSYGRG